MPPPQGAVADFGTDRFGLDPAVSSERRNISAIIRVTDSEEARCSVDEQTMAGD